MPKRQVAAAPTIPPFIQSLLLPLFLIFILSACRATDAPATAHLPVKISSTSTQSPTSTPYLITKKTETPHSPTLTPTPDCMTAGGALQSGQFFSDQLEADFKYHVYLPPCYQASPQQRYPVLYLLHGLLDTNEQWLRLGLVSSMDAMIANQDIPPFIIVLPQEDQMSPPQTSAFPKTLVEELIPWIDAQYATKPEKTFRGIGGISRGAAWAVQIGFENSHLFSRIGAHSLPLFQADGGKVSGWLTQEPVEALPEVFIDIGRSDQEWRTAEIFANQLDDHHIPHEWHLFTGDHTETYWSAHLEQYLRWYARNW